MRHNVIEMILVIELTKHLEHFAKFVNVFCNSKEDNMHTDMSYAVVRGKPSASQLYLDRVLDAILIEKGVKPDPEQRENVTLAQIMYHCLKERPKAEFMTNALTGEVITNEQILKHAISLARSLTAQGAKGKYALLMMRNHQDTVAIYFAVMFAGVVPFMIDPNSTVYELTHFLKLIEPSFVFCDQEFKEALQESLQAHKDLKLRVVVADEPGELKKFADEHSDDIKSYQVSNASMDDPVMMLPTSGSTGMPKAAILTNRGLVAQLPGPWMYHTQFPVPTRRTMILTTIQWVTFTMFVTASTAYQIPILLTRKTLTVEHVTEMLQKYRPTLFYLTPSFATSLVTSIRPDQLSSVETMYVLGSPATLELRTSLIEKLPKTARLCDGYGTTETMGFITAPDRDAPLMSNGWVLNILHYKGYHKKDMSDDESFTPDGWFRTGDEFHLDANERLAFVQRKKFSFKYKGCHVSPEEVERVIGSVPGVHETVVCESERGPVAAVVLDPHADVTREHINKAVDSTLSEHKRLHGGIAFVTSLPHTHSGKVKRMECTKIIAELIKNGKCF